MHWCRFAKLVMQMLHTFFVTWPTFRFGSWRSTHRALWLALALGLLSAGPAWAERCREDTLVGRWQPTWSDDEVWHFVADGELRCDGPCDYGEEFGQPLAWAYDPTANAFGGPISHLKLVFTGYIFEGTVEAYRCEIEADGRRLRLSQMRSEPLFLVRVD